MASDRSKILESLHELQRCGNGLEIALAERARMSREAVSGGWGWALANLLVKFFVQFTASLMALRTIKWLDRRAAAVVAAAVTVTATATAVATATA
ncbi:hypothetical protein Q9L58_008189 [Maublancomyces gigas]|uniref:Uncharacterized protein n=1 Tax=Discina gigas TaxID=1032678 RepID=A0ABR3GB34_9PEZI